MALYELPQCLSTDSSFVSIDEEESAAPRTPKLTATFPKKPKKAKPLRKKSAREIHRNVWLEHRHRVLITQTELDTKPPGYLAARNTGVCNLRLNAEAYMVRAKKNLQLLVELSRTMRTHGEINPFRYDRVYTMSSLPVTMKILDRIDLENKDMIKRLLDVVSEIDTGLKATKKGTKKNHPFQQPFTMSEKGLEKYKGYNIDMPVTDVERWRLLRPHIYLDVHLKGSRPLGRIVVQLFTEAAPIVVLQLMRSCMCNRHEKFVIRRLFPNLWLDVQLWEQGNPDLYQPLEYDGKIIDNGASSYLLSFSKEHLQGFTNYMSFAISFKPLHVVNGLRVAFGQVVKGSKILDCLQSYGTKNGKLNRSIIFTKCGLL